MPLPSAGRPSVHARLVVILAGATPARTATLPSFPFAGAAGGFAGRGRGYGKLGGGGGGAWLAGLGSYTALRRPISNNKNPHFPSYGGGAVLCLARRADGEGAGDGGDHHNADKGTEGAVLCLAQRADGESEGAGGDTEGAGDGSDHHNNKKAYNLRADGEGDGAGGDTAGAGSGGDHHKLRLEPFYALGWAFVQGLVTIFVILLASIVIYQVYYDSAYAFIYARHGSEAWS